MLRIEQLSLALPYYPRFWRRRYATHLDQLSFSVAAGSVHAVVGASGAGKSLLAHTIMGLLPKGAQLGGSCFFKETPLDEPRKRALRGRELALIPQSLSALDPLARSQHQVNWAARRAGLAPASARQTVCQALAHYQLDERARRAYPHELSGGMARRVLTAMAHVTQASLVIADEPTVGLDPAQRGRVLDALAALTRQGKAVMLISHDLRHALNIADRVTVMHEGRCVETADASAFQGTGQTLKSAYARALWQALPDNAFTIDTEYARESHFA
ncbi:ATP-binding cassette domain-containing protein [Vreelandella populi]|uniref:ABC transporter ATP-binding protein n=1 Tax=Vreelandella populi TaxID=2498858 RepID=A0A433LGG0_9GAMM|nr:ATP-binding cassette domain-containing protein [Halomonas populi]RUR37990.1 ABC transporter ATP-binding protein [Halomonas populi]RUR48968.1 ABC transporter ATP-binding protein [Halomonas populi]